MKKVLTVEDYNSEVSLYSPGGVSMTVPNEATSLKDLVHRAMVHAYMPEISQSQAYKHEP